MLMTEQEKVKADIDALVENLGSTRDALIPILQSVQYRYNYISEFAMQIIADRLDIHPTEVFSVVSFYHFLNSKPKGKFIIRLSSDVASMMKGADRIAVQLENDLGIKFGETTPDGMFTLEWTSCMGMNDQAPAMMINYDIYSNLTVNRVNGILKACREEFTKEAVAGQIFTGEANIGETYVNELTYAGIDSVEALKAGLAMKRPDVIAMISESGLRGRGGAGFPTGTKWNLAAAAKSDKKFVVCNADEGEPGTFKDRVILSKYADLVFTGMTVAGHAIGADEGVLYLRGEYTYLRPELETIIARRKADGLLGENVAGKEGFNFDIRIQMGAGAYVCGEETALIESLEGQRGEPRNRPPYPVNTGFFNRPTVVNNVESLAWISTILLKGADWFAAAGTEKSKGYKLFSVSGDCKQPGVYELPWGMTVNELLETVGGEGAMAVQIGGYSGTFVPASEFDRKVAYEDAATGGSIIVYGQGRDPLAIAENYLLFFEEESCGQCTPCRDGNPKLLDGVRKLQEGTCSTKYLDDLLGLCETMKLASKCGLGQASPNIFQAINAHCREKIMGRVQD